MRSQQFDYLSMGCVSLLSNFYNLRYNEADFFLLKNKLSSSIFFSTGIRGSYVQRQRLSIPEIYQFELGLDWISQIGFILRYCTFRFQI